MPRVVQYFKCSRAKCHIPGKKICDRRKQLVKMRKAQLLNFVEPKKAFSLGVKSLHTSTKVPKDILKEIKHQWCNCPEGFESALNYKAYDSEYFFTNNFKPDADNPL